MWRSIYSTLPYISISMANVERVYITNLLLEKKTGRDPLLLLLLLLLTTLSRVVSWRKCTVQYVYLLDGDASANPIPLVCTVCMYDYRLLVEYLLCSEDYSNSNNIIIIVMTS